MNSINRLDCADLECYLNCVKTKKWDNNGGKNRKENRHFKILKENNTYKFIGNNEITPLMLNPETLLDCINSFNKIIFQELIRQKTKI